MAKRNPGLRNRGFATEHRSVDGGDVDLPLRQNGFADVAVSALCLLYPRNLTSATGL